MGRGLLPLASWAGATAGLFAALALAFRTQGLPDHTAMALAAALALLAGHAAGWLLMLLAPGRGPAAGMGLAMAMGLPPLGAFPGLWLGLQALQAALLLLPAWLSLPFALAGMLAMGGSVKAWRHGLAWQAARRDEAAAVGERTTGKTRGIRIARAALMVLGLAAAFLPWLCLLPAQLVAERLTHELPMLLLAFGMLLTPLIPGQASVIPFGIGAIAMAFAAVLLLVLRLTRRAA